MKLHDFTLSPNTRRARLALAEKGITNYQKVQWDLMKGETRTEAFAKINPFHLVPVLELDDGTLIPESRAIMEYADEIGSGPSIVGNDPKSRAAVRAAENLAADQLLRQAGIIFQNTFLKPEPERDPRAVEAARAALTKGMQWANDRLQKHDYLAGNFFSIADITLLCAIEFAGFVQAPIPNDCPNLKRWHERVKQRPSAAALNT